MITEIIVKEIRAGLRTPKVGITYLALVVLIPMAILSGGLRYTGAASEAALQAAVERDRLTNVINFSEDLLERGVHTFRHPSVLSILVGGIEGDSAQRGLASNTMNPEFDVSRFNSVPLLAVFGNFDLEFIVKIVLSIFALVYAFDVVSGERERGTLRQMLASALSRNDLLIGKLVANFLLLMIPFLAPLIVGLVLLVTLYPAVALGGEEWIRTALITLAFVLYAACVFSLGVLVSTLTGRAIMSFLILLMVWVFLLGMVPQTAVLVSELLLPVPTIDNVKRRHLAEFSPAQRAFGRKVEALWQRFHAEELRRRPAEPVERSPGSAAAYERATAEFEEWRYDERMRIGATMALEYQAFASEMRKAGQELVRDRELRQDRQNELVLAICRFATPAGALTFAANRLARTGIFSSDKVFRKNVEEFSRKFSQENQRLIEENPSLAGMEGARADPVDMSSIYPEPVSFAREGLDESVSGVLQDLAYLAALTVFFIGCAFLSFQRYDVR